MDKVTIVMANYIDEECDADTTPKQAYERGFRRAVEKYDAIIRLRDVDNDRLGKRVETLESENRRLMDEIKNLRIECDELIEQCETEVCPECPARIDALDVDELRLLVRNMYTCMEHVDGFSVYYDCENCALNNTSACDFEGRMLALGIEVE